MEIGLTPKEKILEFVEDAKPLAERIKAALGLESGIALDAGCGAAYTTLALASMTGVSFICMDPSERALAAAKEGVELFDIASRVEYKVGSEEKIPLEDNSVDYVISTSSIGAWHNKQQGLEEIHRVLKPGGRAYITGIDWNSYRDYYGMMKQAELVKFAVNNDDEDMWIDLYKVVKEDED